MRTPPRWRNPYRRDPLPDRQVKSAGKILFNGKRLPNAGKLKKLNTAGLILITVVILALAGGTFFALQCPQGGF